jgi:hypothetical protein
MSSARLSSSGPPNSRMSISRYDSFGTFASAALHVRFKPHATLDRSNGCRLFRPRSDGSDLSFHCAFPTLPGHESMVQILSADPTVAVLLLSFAHFFLHLEEFQILKGLDLCSSSLRALHLESRLRSQRCYSS